MMAMVAMAINGRRRRNRDCRPPRELLKRFRRIDNRPVRGQAGKVRRRVYLASLEKKAPLSGPRLGFPAKSGVSTGPGASKAKNDVFRREARRQIRSSKELGR
jgi:hypothetical protein